MLKTQRMLMVAAVAAGGWQLGGCTAPTPPDQEPVITSATIKIDFAAAENAINVYDVETGIPRQRVVEFSSIDTGGITANGGFFDFAITGVETKPDASPAPKGTTAQQVDAAGCLNACAASAIQVAPDLCTDVCTNNAIDVRLWINTFEAVQADCTDGDEYVFHIQLDENNDIVEIVRVPEGFMGQTVDLINSGSFGGCIQVVAPFTGQVLLNELVITIEP
ncbi:MAG: hypothetical protein ACE5E5_08810 [Phycisphaerae bacterium]